MSFGFQLDGLQGDASGFGGAGTAGFGLQPFGGSGYAVWTPPAPQKGSDDPTKRLRAMVGESVLERQGLPIASRVWATRGRWRIIYRAQPVLVIENLRTYFDARRFRLLPDSLDESAYWVVRWTNADFDPQRYPGGQDLYNLTFDLMEVP